VNNVMSKLFAHTLHSMAALILVGYGTACQANEASGNMKRECVGRMQINLPGEAEVAAQTAQSWKLPEGGSGAPPMRFADGRLSGWSYSNPFKISHRLSSAELVDSTRHSELTKAAFEERAKRNFRILKKSFRTDPTSPWVGSTWGYRLSLSSETYFYQRFLVNVNQHLVEWGWSVPESEAAILNTRVTELLNSITPRSPHTVPSEPGLCYPYLFVKDDGQAKREVAISYRLKDHPDITVVLEDKTASVRLRNERSQQHSAEVASISFWGRYIQSDEGAESVWGDYYQSTKLAGYRGVHSYVEIKRADGTIDYGYYISVRGDSEAKEDEPDLTFWVIRNASVAKAKGVQPYGDEKSFLALAQLIATSVKRRPAQ
jgi:Tle cognate immunity protein 4 C-terminal domain